MKAYMKKIVVIAAAIMFLFSLDMQSSAAGLKPAQVKGIKAEVASYNSIQIKWKKLNKASGYEIYRSTKRKSGYKKIKTVTNKNKNSFVNNKRATGKRYYYRVRAYRKIGKVKIKGKFSKIVSARAVPAATKVNNALYFIEPEQEGSGKMKISMSWNVLPEAKGYGIYVKNGAQGTYKLVRRVEGKYSLTADFTYQKSAEAQYVSVRGYRFSQGKKVYGKYSRDFLIKPSKMGFRNILLAGNGAVNLSWYYYPHSCGYNIYRSENPSTGYSRIASITNGVIREYTDKNVQFGKTYFYRIADLGTTTIGGIEGELSEPYGVTVTNAFTISPVTEPYGRSYMSTSTYSETSRQYYTIRSYLDCLENIGGGTLRLQRGNYSFWKTVYIPSNVQVIFEDGVYITQSRDPENEKYGLFVLANRKEASQAIAENTKNGHQGVGYHGYGGAHNISLIGRGNVILDKEFNPGAALMFGHNADILVSGITFKNMNGGSHFIELDASRNVTIQNCTFEGYSLCKGKKGKEAINIDTPDNNTGGFTGSFSSMDGTPNENVYIYNNVFRNLPAAIGTHMYTGGKRHKNIQILNNVLDQCHNYGIHIMNWESPIIKNNQITNMTRDDNNNGGGSSDYAVAFLIQGLYQGGEQQAVIEDNEVINCDRFMVIKAFQYSQSTINAKPGLAGYAPLYNDISQENVIYNTLSEMYGNKADIYYNNEVGSTSHENWTCVGKRPE